MNMTPGELADRIGAMSHVTNVYFWARAPGKEGLYIETVKFNGGKNWNDGLGYSELYVDLASGTLKATGCAGVKTRKALAPTLEAIRALLGLQEDTPG